MDIDYFCQLPDLNVCWSVLRVRDNHKRYYFLI